MVLDSDNQQPMERDRSIQNSQLPSLNGSSLAEEERSVDQLLCSAGSDETPTLSIVMPTLNEVGGIEECMRRAKSAIEQLQVPTEIIVSDSSTDRTPDIARQLGAVVVEPDESGYGNAYKHAFRHARGEFIAMGDADTTYNFEELPKLIHRAVADNADMVLGSRLEGTIEPGAMPRLHQYVGNPLLTKFLNAFYEANVSDAHSGMRVITREALAELDLQTGGMEFASEMLMDAAAKGMTIEEVPITYHEREGEATLDSFRDGWRHVRFMLVNAPGYLYTLPASCCLLFGAVMTVLSLGGIEAMGVPFGLQTMIGGTLMIIIGYQVVSLGLFSTIATEPIREPKDRFTDWINQHFRLEYGASVGVVLFTIGAVYLGTVIGAWFISGDAAIPSATWNLLASTVVIIGAQTVFSSFFLSTLATSRQR